jgi:AmmeMemoRadiSam system protein A
MDKSLQQALLILARESMAAHLAGKELPVIPVQSLTAEYTGAFVSLHHGPRLRGCIGRFECKAGVPHTVQRVAIAALGDPRFTSQPVTLDELSKISTEISLLLPMWRTADPLHELDLNVHGLFIRRDMQAGCFLPKVAAMMRWNVEQLLSRCCSDKAGLPADAWKDPLTEVYLFATETFSDQP